MKHACLSSDLGSGVTLSNADLHDKTSYGSPGCNETAGGKANVMISWFASCSCTNELQGIWKVRWIA